MRVVALIPAYNEEQAIADVLLRVRPFVSEVIVVDDGSHDATGKMARDAGAIVVRHAINRGLGAAIGTGFAAAKVRGADVVVTLDADGQHDPAEIPLFLAAIEEGAAAVIGSRRLTREHLENIPLIRHAAHMAGNLITYVLFGAWVTDSQSGFRAFTRAALEKIEVRTNRMEISSELIAEAKRHNLVLREVPIQAIYTDYSLSKGQSFTVGIKTLAKLILRRLG